MERQKSRAEDSVDMDLRNCSWYCYCSLLFANVFILICIYKHQYCRFILWLGGAVLVASVARTRIRDMDQFLNAGTENPHVAGAISDDNGSPEYVEDEKP
ncbi:hypothetical protein ACS0TY_005076 [Phlomoides rotata]